MTSKILFGSHFGSNFLKFEKLWQILRKTETLVALTIYLFLFEISMFFWQKWRKSSKPYSFNRKLRFTRFIFGATCPIWTDDLLIHTTIVFTTIAVCSLDFLFTIDNSLGTPYKVSTLGFLLARDYQQKLRLPRISGVHFKDFSLKVQDSSK